MVSARPEGAVGQALDIGRSSIGNAAPDCGHLAPPVPGAGRDALIASNDVNNPTRPPIAVTPDSPVCRPIKIRLLATLALLLLAGPGQAQISNLLSAKPKSETVKPAEAPAAVDPRTEAEKQLAEARRQQEAGRIESGTAPDAEQLPTTEHQRLLDRLVAAYGERLNLMDEADGLRKAAPKLQDRSEQIAEFADAHEFVRELAAPPVSRRIPPRPRRCRWGWRKKCP
jgi:hypothetical protein